MYPPTKRNVAPYQKIREPLSQRLSNKLTFNPKNYEKQLCHSCVIENIRNLLDAHLVFSLLCSDKFVDA